MTLTDYTFKDFDIEAFFVARLAQHGKSITIGNVDRAIRKERIRQAIIDAEFNFSIIGRNPAGKSETYSQCFERFYGEPLSPSRKRNRNAHT